MASTAAERMEQQQGQPDGGSGVVQEDLLYFCDNRPPRNVQLQEACGDHQAIWPEDVCARRRAALPSSILIPCTQMRNDTVADLCIPERSVKGLIASLPQGK